METEDPLGRVEAFLQDSPIHLQCIFTTMERPTPLGWFLRIFELNTDFLDFINFKKWQPIVVKIFGSHLADIYYKERMIIVFFMYQTMHEIFPQSFLYHVTMAIGEGADIYAPSGNTGRRGQMMRLWKDCEQSPALNWYAYGFAEQWGKRNNLEIYRWPYGHPRPSDTKITETGTYSAVPWRPRVRSARPWHNTEPVQTVDLPPPPPPRRFPPPLAEDAPTPLPMGKASVSNRESKLMERVAELEEALAETTQDLNFFMDQYNFVHTKISRKRLRDAENKRNQRRRLTSEESLALATWKPLADATTTLENATAALSNAVASELALTTDIMPTVLLGGADVSAQRALAEWEQSLVSSEWRPSPSQ